MAGEGGKERGGRREGDMQKVKHKTERLGKQLKRGAAI